MPDAGTVGNAPMQGQQGQKLPFRFQTRQEINRAFNPLAFTLGGQVFDIFPKIGHLAKTFIRFDGLITSTSAGADTITYGDFGAYAIFKNLQIDLNSGKQILLNSSGWDLFLLNQAKRTMGRPDQQTDSDFYNAPTSGTAQPFRVTLEFPHQLSDGLNFALGTVNLQAPELQAQFQATFPSALSEVGTNISAITGNVNVFYEYYDVPDPVTVQQPPVVLHKFISQSNVIASTGENIVEIPRGGKLLRILQTIRLNGARSNSWDSRLLRINKTQQWYNEDRWLTKWRERLLSGYSLPTGVSVFDFAEGYSMPEESDSRDYVDTEQATTTETVINISSGASLGTNNNFIITAREFIQIPAQ